MTRWPASLMRMCDPRSGIIPSRRLNRTVERLDDHAGRSRPLSRPGFRATLLAFVDVVKLAFIGLLAYLSVTILDRMTIQRMTVFDLPMSYVYAGVALGCFLMLLRQIQTLWRNARIGWRKPHELTDQIQAD